MNCFVFVGPPGSGKGTQCALLSQRLSFTHVSTGALIREEIASGSSLGKAVKQLVESGGLVDDETIVKCLSSHLDGLSETRKKIILLDGIPRNLKQAHLLSNMLPGAISGVIYLSADPKELVARFAKRWHCTKCGKVESFEYSPSSDYLCPACGKENSYKRRKDDEPTVVLSRFEIYQQQTTDLLNYYKNLKILYEFDALQPIEVTYAHVGALILQKVSIKC
jgi:adenylate kinase